MTAVSPAYLGLNGLPPETPKPDFATWLALVHPEVRYRAAAAARAGLAAGSYQDEFRIRRADGALRWIAAGGRTLCDATGQPVHFLGIIIDITERKTTALADAAGGTLPMPDAFDLAALGGAANAYRVAVESTEAQPAF